MRENMARIKWDSRLRGKLVHTDVQFVIASDIPIYFEIYRGETSAERGIEKNVCVLQSTCFLSYTQRDTRKRNNAVIGRRRGDKVEGNICGRCISTSMPWTRTSELACLVSCIYASHTL